MRHKLEEFEGTSTGAFTITFLYITIIPLLIALAEVTAHHTFPEYRLFKHQWGAYYKIPLFTLIFLLTAIGSYYVCSYVDKRKREEFWKNAEEVRAQLDRLEKAFALDRLKKTFAEAEKIRQEQKKP